MKEKETKQYTFAHRFISQQNNRSQIEKFMLFGAINTKPEYLFLLFVSHSNWISIGFCFCCFDSLFFFSFCFFFLVYYQNQCYLSTNILFWDQLKIGQDYLVYWFIECSISLLIAFLNFHFNNLWYFCECERVHSLIWSIFRRQREKLRIIIATIQWSMTPLKILC